MGSRAGLSLGRASGNHLSSVSSSGRIISVRPLRPTNLSSGRLPRSVVCAATTTAAQQLDLHINETTISVPLAPACARELDQGFTQLLQTFADKAKAVRPQRWEMMEVRFKGDPAAGELELFEVFCNPNAHQTPFEAKLLISIRAQGGVKITTEARLVTVKSDLDAYLQTATS